MFPQILLEYLLHDRCYSRYKNEYGRKGEVSFIEILMCYTMYLCRAGTWKCSAHSTPTIDSQSIIITITAEKTEAQELARLVSPLLINGSMI